MNPSLQRLERLLQAIGDRSRFRLLLELVAGERHVSDLAGQVGLSQSCTTRHVQALVRARVVHARRAGKRVMIALDLDVPEVAWLARQLRAAAAPDATRVEPPPAATAARARAAESAMPPAERAHAAGPGSGTPPPAPADTPQAAPASADDLEDFLL